MSDVHWIGAAPTSGMRLSVQLRAHSAPSPVTVSRVSRQSVLLHSDPPITQVAPGQACVVYDGDEVLGGGVVTVP
jgi:tRNA-specific 2-thiouridylase